MTVPRSETTQCGSGVHGQPVMLGILSWLAEWVGVEPGQARLQIQECGEEVSSEPGRRCQQGGLRGRLAVPVGGAAEEVRAQEANTSWWE